MACGTGRKQNIIWLSFERIPNPSGKIGDRAKCLKCKKVMAGLVQRMRKHYAECYNQSQSEMPEDTFASPDETVISDDDDYIEIQSIECLDCQQNDRPGKLEPGLGHEL